MNAADYIDPKVVFTILSKSGIEYLNLAVEILGYDIDETATDAATAEELIDKMVVCENISRLKGNVDNLLALRERRLTEPLKINSPRHALHLILQGVQYSTAAGLEKSSIAELLTVIYSLKDKIDFEVRINYSCRRGLFPCRDVNNIKVARALFGMMNHTQLLTYVICVSNIVNTPTNVNISSAELVNIIVTGEPVSDNDCGERYLAMKSANALMLFEDISRFVHNTGVVMISTLVPSDITSYLHVSNYMESRFFLEWSASSGLETMLSGNDLSNVVHCKNWESQLGMKLPNGTWISTTSEDSLRVFYNRLVEYAPHFMRNRRGFESFGSSDPVSPLDKAISLHCMTDTALFEKHIVFEFGNKRSTFINMCIKEHDDQNLLFFHVVRGEANKVNSLKSYISFGTESIPLMNFVIDWMCAKHGGEGGALRDLDEMQPFIDLDQDPVAVFGLYSPQNTLNRPLLPAKISQYRWPSTNPFNEWVADGHAGPTAALTRDTFSAEQLLSMYTIMMDGGYFSTYQRELLVSIIQPTLESDAARKLPTEFFLARSQTEQNLIMQILTALQHIGHHLMLIASMHEPEVWQNRNVPCLKKDVNDMQICRRHLAHWILVHAEVAALLSVEMQEFVYSLWVHKLIVDSVAFVEDRTLDLRKVVTNLDIFAKNIYSRIGNKRSKFLSLGPEGGDGGLKIVDATWSGDLTKHPVATELNIWLTTIGLLPGVIYNTACYYLSTFGTVGSAFSSLVSPMDM